MNGSNMMKLSAFALILAALLLAACSGSDDESANASRGAGHADEDAHETGEGPHGGRLLTDGDVRVELAIYESGVDPEFRAWAWRGEEPLGPTEWRLNVNLTRLGNLTESFDFSPGEDYLRGAGVVREPHSFEVEVKASVEGSEHRWKYDSFEGRTTISANAAQASGIEIETAGPARITETLNLQGTIVPDPGRVFHIRPRFPGVIKSIRVSVGDKVRAGDVLATIEASDSLRPFTLTAPSNGEIVNRRANAGEVVTGGDIFTLIDLASVWVELAAFQHDLDRLDVGQTVTIRDTDGHREAVGKVGSISPVGSPASQSMTARVILPNEKGYWRPGLFVSGAVTFAETDVPLAVRRSALQTFRDWNVVFQKVGETYEIRPVTLGRMNAVWAEVLDGLDAGAEYVTGNSFVIKADIEKSGAKHDH